MSKKLQDDLSDKSEAQRRRNRIRKRMEFLEEISESSCGSDSEYPQSVKDTPLLDDAVIKIKVKKKVGWIKSQLFKQVSLRFSLILIWEKVKVVKGLKDELKSSSLKLKNVGAINISG